MTSILGISAFYHDSAACILKNGEIIAAAQEERFTRKKHDSSYPHNAIEFVLKYANLKLSEVDQIVFFEKPFLKFERLLETYVAFAPKGFISFSKAMPLWVKDKLFQKNLLFNNLKKHDKEYYEGLKESLSPEVGIVSALMTGIGSALAAIVKLVVFKPVEFVFKDMPRIFTKLFSSGETKDVSRASRYQKKVGAYKAGVPNDSRDKASRREVHHKHEKPAKHVASDKRHKTVDKKGVSQQSHVQRLEKERKEAAKRRRALRNRGY